MAGKLRAGTVLTRFPSNAPFGCRAAAVVGLMIYSLLQALPAAAAGSILIEAAQLTPQDKGYLLDADTTIELNPTIERGLQSGVPLYFNLDFRILRYRRFWWDSKVWVGRRRFSLVYYELTRHYRVSVVGEDVARNFRSLLDALEYAGTLRDWSLELDETLDPNERYRAEIQYGLDLDALPLALRPQVLVSSAWRLRSEEFHWYIN